MSLRENEQVIDPTSLNYLLFDSEDKYLKKIKYLSLFNNVKVIFPPGSNNYYLIILTQPQFFQGSKMGK